MRVYKYLVLILILFIQSCASTEPQQSGYDRSEVVLTSMETVHNNIKTTTDHLGEVESALSELIRPGQANIKSAYDEYSKNVANLDNSVNQLLNNSDKLATRSDEYLNEWQNEDTQYENSRLQNLSEERREELSEAYEEVETSTERVKNRLRNFVTDNKEIRDYLDNDLTSTGVESITNLARDVLQESDELQDRLDDLENSLEDAMAEMARRGN